jgi:hypothetical protein
MSVPTNRINVFQFLEHVAYFQGSLALLGIFVRGAVVVGEHFEDNQILFGPALIQAVYLEKKIAIWPRVVVAPDVVNLCNSCTLFPSQSNSDKDQLNHLLRRDSGGITYLNYIRTYCVVCNSTEQSQQFLQKHHNHIIQKARASAEHMDVSTKYYWVATYHNDEVAQLNYQQLQIDMPSTFPGL